MPAAQGEQLADLAAEKEPGAHGWHVEAAMAPVAAEKVPAAQLVHAATELPPAVAA